MKLLTWNIQHGGGSRLTRIAQAIAAHNPDVIALTEFRTRPGQALVAALKEGGRPYAESTAPVGIDNGICVISRVPMVRTRACPAPPENITRWLDVDFPDLGFGIGVLHILCSVSKRKDRVPGEAKTRFWNAWTWYSKLKGGARGNGFRIDHCFATPSLRPRIASCRYSHREREAGISDHSLMIVEVKRA